MSRITLTDARVGLLTDMTSAVFAYERRSGRTDNAAVVAAVVAVAVIAVVIGVRIAAERRGCDCTDRTDRAADHARGYLSRPETVVAMIDPGLILLMTDRWRPCCRILRHGRRSDRSRDDCGCG